MLATDHIAASWNFIYDGDGKRVRQEYFEGVFGADIAVKVTSYYMGGAYELDQSGVVDANGTILVSNTTTLKYYSFAGQPVAMTSCEGGTCAALTYLLTDQLGSVVAVTNASGALLSQQRYLPFGQVRTGAGTLTQTDIGFTGQRNLDAQGNSFSLGLMDYHARFYDARIMEFQQPDTIIPNEYDPQTSNRYAYVLNNPINFSDPSGQNACAAFVNGMCVHEVSDADQQLINANGATITSPSSSVVVISPRSSTEPTPTVTHNTEHTVIPPTATPFVLPPYNPFATIIPTQRFCLAPTPTTVPGYNNCVAPEQQINQSPVVLIPINTLLGWSHSSGCCETIADEVVIGQGFYISAGEGTSSMEGNDDLGTYYIGLVGNIYQPNDYTGPGNNAGFTVMSISVGVFGGQTENSPVGFIIGLTPGVVWSTWGFNTYTTIIK